MGRQADDGKGRGGDGDRIGGERVVCPFGSVGEPSCTFSAITWNLDRLVLAAEVREGQVAGPFLLP